MNIELFLFPFLLYYHFPVYYSIYYLLSKLLVGRDAYHVLPEVLGQKARWHDSLGEYPEDLFVFVEGDVVLLFLNTLRSPTNMPLSAVELQRVMAILADEDELKVTVKSAAYGGVVAGITTTVGGLLAGPPGLMIGGAVGGLLAYNTTGNFKPVSAVIKHMNAHERQLLYDTMKDIIDNLHIDDYLALIAFLSGGPGLLVREQLMDRMASFLRDQMRLQMAT